jgi:hypothetical protein
MQTLASKSIENETRPLKPDTVVGTSEPDSSKQSASQFSREYARFFGNAPTKDIARLMEQGFTAADVSR